MKFTFKRQHEGVEEEYTLTDISEGFLEELLLKMLDKQPVGLDSDFLQFTLHSLSFEEMAAAYEAANLPDNPYEAAKPLLEAHRPLPKAGGEAHGEFIEIKRASDSVPSFVHQPRVRQFRRQDGLPGVTNYAVQICCSVCGREAEGWSREERQYVKCPTCKSKLLVQRMYRGLHQANEKGQCFKASEPLDYSIGSEML